MTVERRARFVTVALALALAWVAIGVTVGPLAAADHPAARHRLAGRLQTRVLPGVPGEVLAGRYEVFEDRRAGNGRKIPLDIVVLPARNARPEPEPLVFLAGGDLPPATQWAPFLARGLEKLRNERDILLVDSRGTGASHRLDCQLPDPFLDPALATDPGAWQRAVKRCRDELAAGADLRLYTTPLAMDDLFEVCEWLGWSKIDLWGVSYGTKAARVFVRQHPGHVRTMVLSGVLPLAPTTWKERAASAQRGLDRVVTDCERDSSCAKSFPNLHDEVDSLLARVARRPVPLQAANGKGGAVVVPIDEAGLRDRIYTALSHAESRAELPYVLHAAYAGDWEPFRRWIRVGDDAMPHGAAACLICTEDIAPSDAHKPNATAGAEVAASERWQLAICNEWPRGWLPRSYFEPVAARLPALLLTGELDHVAPPEYAEKAAWHWSGARVQVLPGRGHADLDACVLELVQDFVRSAGKVTLDRPCLHAPHRFVTAAADLAPAERP